MMAICGCTQNNGHIGPWFGQWKVERITVDGVNDSDYAGDCFFCFQSHVFGVRRANGAMYYGKWEELETTGTLKVTFNTKDSSVPKGLHFDGLSEDPSGYPYLEMRIAEVKGSTKKLEYVCPTDGKTYIYHLKKW